MVFSEQGDAYTDSQHINDCIMTIRTRDLYESQHNFDKTKGYGSKRESSVYMFQ